MEQLLKWNTVSPLLKKILIDLMNEELFQRFRLVGGTALSLQIGHRMSVDIDLFSDANYGSVDFEKICSFLKNKYAYFESSPIEIVGMGTYFFVGNSKYDFIKIDLFYTDSFVFDSVVTENVRMADEKEIIAMKLDIVLRNGRKKDFWDIHYYLERYNLDELIAVFQKRYPYNDDFHRIKTQLLNFEQANLDFEPRCLMNKNWEFIKLDFYEFMG